CSPKKDEQEMAAAEKPFEAHGPPVDALGVKQRCDGTLDEFSHGQDPSRARFLDHPSQAGDPGVDLLKRGVGEVEPHRIFTGSIAKEGGPGNKSNLLLDRPFQKLGRLDVPSQRHPGKEAAVGSRPGDRKSTRLNSSTV